MKLSKKGNKMPKIGRVVAGPLLANTAKPLPVDGTPVAKGVTGYVSAADKITCLRAADRPLAMPEHLPYLVYCIWARQERSEATTNLREWVRGLVIEEDTVKRYEQNERLFSRQNKCR
jgi:hypothetical protein